MSGRMPPPLQYSAKKPVPETLLHERCSVPCSVQGSVLQTDQDVPKCGHRACIAARVRQANLDELEVGWVS